ncbi:MAG: acetoacetate--CoA ligase [Ahrensia sp.]|nr:acetoacetate--CoA ligase [Ahrensia sp.]
MPDNILWTPSPARIHASQMRDFADFCSSITGLDFSSYQSLHAWSVSNMAEFWDAAWDYCGVIGDKGDVAIKAPNAMPGATFFPEAQLSFAENMLKRRGEDTAIVFRGEDKIALDMSWDALHALVSLLQQAFRAKGVRAGDRIAGMVPNIPETVACMLAANSIGAIWSSCSPDFGTQGVLDRFGQIKPTIFVACDGYWYNGKKIDIGEKVAQISCELGVETTVILPYLAWTGDDDIETATGIPLADFVAPYEARDVQFERLPFDHPLYILFSSGTTGVPKCIIHRQGGILLQHLKEHKLHCNISPGQRVFWFTTCGWMMWNWLVSALAADASVMLYDGSPFHPTPSTVFDYAEQEKFNLLGTSPKFIDATRKAGLRPIETHDLSSVHTIASTGSPLAPENFRFVYDAIKSNTHLASVSGGTDLAACFVCAIPWEPVRVGEIQGPALGMASDVWDDDGRSVRAEKGELVCTQPFPSMPLGFWNDDDGLKYHHAYFERFEGVWCHGDFAEITENGGYIIYGRSDATLNPGGVRIGTAEIYNQVEQMPQVLEALCIGQEWDNDTRIVLFVKLAEGLALDDDLRNSIKSKIRTGASPRHVPAIILQVADIPRTKSGKIVELAVRDIVHGRPVKNKEALANPEALELFAGFEELSE